MEEMIIIDNKMRINLCYGYHLNMRVKKIGYEEFTKKMQFGVGIRHGPKLASASPNQVLRQRLQFLGF